ncbi:MAG: vanadium-dependent haloperoxidase [Opitutus sp.]
MKIPPVRLRLVVGLFCWAAATVSVAFADVVLEWNATMTGYNERQPPPGVPPLELRAYALAHLAMLNAIERATHSHGHAEAAAAQAAHNVLVNLLPGGAPDFDALLVKQLAGITDGPDKLLGISAGTQAAIRVLADQADDGATKTEGAYKPGAQPGNYQFTAPFDGPPFNGYAHFPKLGEVRPLVLKSARQFRVPAPATLLDSAYVADFNEIKSLGAHESTARTVDQTNAARFWFEMSAFGWNRVARILAAKQTGSLLEHARLFATLNIAMYDSLVAAFESKYVYNFWRPITAIHAAETDGNALTAADTAWEPLMHTPPMPDYPSSHSALGGAAEVVLSWFFHGDEQTFTLPTTMVSQFPELQPRTFHRLSDAALENATSRMFAGIHFRSSCLAGLKQGREVGHWVVQHALSADGH